MHAQVAKFDKHIVSTRIRAGRSIAELALPPATDRKQRRTVETLLKNALAQVRLQGGDAGAPQERLGASRGALSRRR